MPVGRRIVADIWLLFESKLLTRKASTVSGHLNHTLFWENLAPQKNNGGKLDQGECLTLDRTIDIPC